jgi:hypothetical protein
MSKRKSTKQTLDEFDPMHGETAAPGYRRGKATPLAKASWGAKNGDGMEHRPEEGVIVLGEALGN